MGRYRYNTGMTFDPDNDYRHEPDEMPEEEDFDGPEPPEPEYSEYEP
jgi:hypothetical protein